MEIRVLYFAALRDLLQRSEERLELPDEIRTVGDLRGYLSILYPVLGDSMAQVRCARNEAFAELEDVLVPGDVIALIPPVAGG